MIDAYALDPDDDPEPKVEASRGSAKQKVAVVDWLSGPANSPSQHLALASTSDGAYWVLWTDPDEDGIPAYPSAICIKEGVGAREAAIALVRAAWVHEQNCYDLERYTSVYAEGLLSRAELDQMADEIWGGL